MVDKKEIRETGDIISVLILFLAIPVANLTRAITGIPIKNISEVLLLLALIGLLPSNLKKLIYIQRKCFWLMFYLLVLCIASLIGKFYTGPGGFIYNLYAAALLFVVANNDREFPEEKFLKAAFYISGIVSVIAVYVFTKGFTNFGFRINTIYTAAGEILADRLSLSELPAVCIIACLAYESRRKRDILLKGIFLFSSVLMLIIVNRRGKIIILAFVFALWFVYQMIDNRVIIRKSNIASAVAMLILAVIAVYCLLHQAWFVRSVNYLLDSVQRAVLSAFGAGTDASGTTRYELRQGVLAELENFTLMELLLGKGYMYQYLDFPLLQAFIDTGMLGGCYFLWIQWGVPLKYILQKQRTPFQKFANYFLLMGMINILFNGLPYGWDKYVYIIVAYIAYLKHDSVQKAASL